MDDIKLAVIPPGFFPTRRVVRMFAESCLIHGIEPIYYCEGEPYCQWTDLKIKKQIPCLQSLGERGYSHVLYTDSRDAFFLADLDLILDAYRDQGSPPILASANAKCEPNPTLAQYFPDNVGRFRFHCQGGYIAEIPWLIEKFMAMLPYTEHEGDDALIWAWGYRDGWFRPAFDHQCLIFQTEDEAQLEVVDGRLRNIETGTWPMVLHVNGAHSDPISGKYDRMLPWWSALYPDIPLSKGECSA